MAKHLFTIGRVLISAVTLVEDSGIVHATDV
jgi:hypothetical protein